MSCSYPLMSGALAAVLLNGCATLPSGSGLAADAAVAEQDSLRLLVAESRDRLRALVADLAVPASPAAQQAANVSAGHAAASLEAARANLIGLAAFGGSEPTLAGKAELAILGATLTICRESLRKIDRRKGSDWPEAARLARGELSYACLLPLSAVSQF